MQITVSYSSGDVIKKDFPNTAKGNRDSIKYLKELHDEQLNHPWYYLAKKIEIRKDNLKWERGKKKQRLEIELAGLEADRKEWLTMMGIDGPPDYLKIEITHK